MNITFTMTSGSRILLFLAIASFAICTIAVEEQADDAAIVHIISDLPKQPGPVDVVCKFNGGSSLGEHTLNAGDDYQWSAQVKTVYYCRAIWGNRFAAWHAYEPSRDASHGTVFWLVKDHGIFLSWDKSSWVKKVIWETE
ncbi:hypothetical protein L1049_021415 [Liquidambar formosana]|uniref:S-protein homolog n=1 Tax=Liquidambar formosana TaxID=63359 RepID=A0AAP0N4R0_LIQFO